MTICAFGIRKCNSACWHRWRPRDSRRRSWLLPYWTNRIGIRSSLRTGNTLRRSPISRPLRPPIDGVSLLRTPAERTRIINHLKIDAETETRRKKPLRSNPIATWELRLDKFRVFYIVERKHAKEMTIMNLKVVAVGHKERNEIFIRGKKVLI